MPKTHYEPHPVSPERKAELRDKGFTIVDARFAPDDWEPPKKRGRPKKTEQPEAAQEIGTDGA